MSNIPDKLYDTIKSNLKNPRMYAVIIILIFSVLWLFPYLDANLFYYKRVNDRVDILTKISNLDSERIQQDPTLKAEYESILNELSQQPESTINNIFQKESRGSVNLAKFITGGLLSWVIAFACLKMSGINTIPKRLLGLILFFIIGVVLGSIAKATPNIFNPWVNYIGFPLLQVVVIALLMTSKKENK